MLTLVFAASSPGAQAQPAPATVEDAVAAALSRPALDRALTAEQATIRAASDADTTTPSPTLALDYEQVIDDAIGGLEFTASVSQTFDLDGWRGRHRAAVPHLQAAAHARAEALRLDLDVRTRDAFYAVRFHEDRLAAIEAWQSQLAWGTENLRKRFAQGDASRFAVKRLEREQALARVEHAIEQTALAEARAKLQALTGWPETRPLTGTLLPAASSETASAEAPPTPSIVALSHQSKALAAHAARWGNPMLRGWTLGAGYRLARADELTGHGVVVSLSLPLVLWNTDAPAIEAVQAQRVATREQLAAATRQWQRDRNAAAARLAQTWEAVRAHPNDAEQTLAPLAEKAFRAGEATLTELLEVYERETRLRLGRIGLEMAVRQATGRLDALAPRSAAPRLHPQEGAR